jgi:hypothetical protein
MYSIRTLKRETRMWVVSSYSQDSESKIRLIFPINSIMIIIAFPGYNNATLLIV